MKMLANLVLCACIAFPAISKAQNTSPVKNDNRITVHTNLLKDSLFNITLLMLAERGYAIDSKDRHMGLLSTAERTPPKFGGSIKLSAIVKDSTVTFYGQFRSSSGTHMGSFINLPGLEDIYYGSMRGADMKQAFEEMNAAAGVLAGDKTYWKK